MNEVKNPAGNNQQVRKSRLFVVFFVTVVVLVVLGALVMFQRRSQFQALAENTETLAVPTVAIIHPLTESRAEDLVLPGTLQAYVESPIYARTNGYLVKWYHDIGSRVNKGDLLADIETPEVDQQLMQAKADLVTAQANEHLSEITEARYSELLKTDGVSKQEVDNATGDLAAKKAIVQSSEANVRRLQELKSFQKVYAPFTGVVTQRNVDIGTLINAGNGGTSQQLFYLAQTDPIRVYVNVPESYAPSIHKGLGAFLELAQYPGQRFQGEVVRTAEAIDLATRTLLTEVDVPNKSGLLLPGGYAQVHLEVHVQGDRLQVPVNALLFRSEGLRAVVIDANHRVRLQALSIGRDYGTSLEVLTGLKPEDWIVLNPPDSIENGEEVRVKEVKDPLAATAAPAPTQAPTPTSAPEKPTSSPAEKH
ncbi:MAG TPA: efflux RND transporter periplasmic adaptor subunit [Candidatus Eremiobacteraceae bacterium]|nr:efflux RND transporter periplasmic adaptor subunit [Candidatus Eremiobacteraceae bacterium]